uniref:Uncharacterized protein n=1 Tax=Oryza nivara TaxID=4536 RepID=A0A0E0IKX4_ORYNI
MERGAPGIVYPRGACRRRNGGRAGTAIGINRCYGLEGLPRDGETVKGGDAWCSADKAEVASGRRHMKVFDACFPVSGGPQLPQWQRRQHDTPSTPSNLQLWTGSPAIWSLVAVRLHTQGVRRNVFGKKAERNGDFCWGLSLGCKETALELGVTKGEVAPLSLGVERRRAMATSMTPALVAAWAERLLRLRSMCERGMAHGLAVEWRTVK